MSFELLQILIKAACSDGNVTSAERLHLESEALKIGVSIENLEFLINAELENFKKIDNSGFVVTEEKTSENSGFITENEDNINGSGFIVNDKKNLESGFVTDNSSDKNVSSSNQTFTDITVLAEQGAMSLVQKGKYHGKWVVIKRLKPEFVTNDKYVELFYKEFENAYFLDHQNIARINGKGEDTEGIYYYMEFVDGRSLDKLYSTSGIEDGKLIKKISCEVLDALSYVHKRQIFHRDLKPSNILVTFKGDNVKLIDFGLALADSYDDNLKQVGTPKYAPPEQFTQGFNADARSDIYSFGLILLEMLTGQISNPEFAKIRSVECYNLIKRCIENNPENRFANCDEIIEIMKVIEIQNSSQNQGSITNFESGPPVNKIEDIQTLYEFFKFTHYKWKNGDLHYLDNKYSDEPTFEEQARNSTYFDLIIKNFDKNFENCFKNNFFVKGEYLVKYDKKNLLLTNYSVYLRNSVDESFKLIYLNKINPDIEKINAIKTIYVNFRNFKIWRSDWELILKLLIKKEWTLLTENQIKILETKKDQARKFLSEETINLSFEPYSLYSEDFPFTSIFEFVSESKRIWETIEYSKYYGNRIYDHSDKIKNYLPIIEDVFSVYYPFKNEFLILDCFHNKGFITNFRLFFYDELNKKYSVICLTDVESYSVTEDTYLEFGGMELVLRNKNKIYLPLKYQSPEFARTLKNEISRIKNFILREDAKALLKANKTTYLTLTKNEILTVYF